MDDPELRLGGLQPVSAAPAGALERVHEQLEAIYRTESRRVFATLIRLLGDFSYSGNLCASYLLNFYSNVVKKSNGSPGHLYLYPEFFSFII